MHKRFLNPDTIGLNATDSSATMSSTVKHCDVFSLQGLHNCREYRLPDIPHFSFDCICTKTWKLEQVFCCYFHGHARQTFSDLSTISGDILVEDYEHTVTRVEKIAPARYQFQIH